MRVFTNYIFRELLPPFVLGVSVFTFLFLIDKVYDLLSLKVGEGVPLAQTLKLFVYIQPAILAITIPMGVLVAVLVVFARLSAENEIVAIRASGISLLQLSRPVLLLGLLASMLMVVFMDQTLPWGNHSYVLQYRKIIEERLSVALQERTFVSSFKNRVIYVGGKRGPVLTDVLVYLRRVGGDPTRTIVAPRGRLISDMAKGSGDYRACLELEDGVISTVGTEGVHKYMYGDFEKMLLDLAPEEEREMFLWGEEKGPREMDLVELWSDISERRVKHDPSLDYYLVEWHKRISIPFACLACMMIGIPLGVKTRRGGVVGFGLSCLLVLLYNILLILGENLGGRGMLSPPLAVWLPNIVLGVAGLFFYYLLAVEHRGLVRRSKR